MRRLLLFILLIVALAGCNLDNSNTTIEILEASPTPLIVPTLPAPFGPLDAQSVSGATVTPGDALLVTPVPLGTLVEAPEPSPVTQNAIEVFVNNILIPIWNFLYTLVVDGLVSLWVFAGARGGWFAQIFCCIAPGVVAVIVVLARIRLRRRR